LLHLWAMVLLIGGALNPGLGWAEPTAQVTTITPAKAGDQVVCRLITAGLPGEKLLQSMRSGLVSEVDFDLALLDEREQVVGGSRLELQLAFDLWEEVFSVRSNGQEQRFAELTALHRYLQDLEQVTVAPLSSLDRDGRYRILVGLQVHPIAPSQRDEVEAAISGDQRPRREGLDQQEVSVSLGRLIRFFYKGGGDEQSGQTLISAWFRGGDLRDATN